MPTIQVFQLTEADNKNFTRVAKKNPFNVYTDTDLSSNLLGLHLQEALPEPLNRTLKKMGTTGSPDIILIKGLPLDENISDSSSIERRLLLKGKISESVLVGMANIMRNHLSSNPKEQGGKVIHNISPVKGFENTSSSKSKDPFYLHVENPFDRENPDFLMLYCLNPDMTAKTSYYFIDEVLKKIPDEHLSVMKKPLFEIRSGAGHDMEEKGIFSLLEENSSGIKRLRLYEKIDRITPLTVEAERTLLYLSGFFEKLRETKEIPAISLKRGELLIFNNGWGINDLCGVMHGREGTISNPNRWLQRSFLKRSNKNKIVAETSCFYRAVVEIIKQEERFGSEVINLLIGAAVLNKRCAHEVERHARSPMFYRALKANNNVSTSILYSIKQEKKENTHRARL